MAKNLHTVLCFHNVFFYLLLLWNILINLLHKSSYIYTYCKMMAGEGTGKTEGRSASTVGFLN